MSAWHSLYLPVADAAAVAVPLRESLAALGYTLFDPFGTMPGRAYPKAVRLFVAPPNGGWIRVVGEPDARQLPALSALAPVVYATLDAATPIRVYASGAESDVEALSPYLRAGKTTDDLRAARSSPTLTIADEQPDGLPMGALPDEVRALAGGIDLKHAQSIFARLTGSALKRAGQDSTTADAARSLIAASHPPVWIAPAGRQLQAFMACLTVPDDWQSPDFVTLRDAYQVAARLRLRPNADLYPGDAEALAQVSNPLDYTPIYGGSAG